jgi:hypothetical protein
MEMVSVKMYQHLDNVTKPEIPYEGISREIRCLSIIKGNGADGATYYGPNALFECSILMLPVSPVTSEWIDKKWAESTVSYLNFHIQQGGVCVFPDPSNMSANPCGGSYGPNWWGNEWACCPTDQGYPTNQWRAYPDWFPYLYILQSLYDTNGAWSNLAVNSLFKPNPPHLPFPYVNQWGAVVGYQHDLTRTLALFSVATFSDK